MNPFWISTLIVGGVCGAGVLWMVARLLSYRHALAGGAPGEFTPERYEPMAQLLSAEDAAFLAEQPGVDRRQLDEFERDRRETFRLYLMELAVDFQGLHRQARELVAVAPEKHADLVGMLLGQQVSFWVALAGIELQLALAPLGLARVDPSRLLDLVGSMGAAVQRATSVGGPMPA